MSTYHESLNNLLTKTEARYLSYYRPFAEQALRAFPKQVIRAVVDQIADDPAIGFSHGCVMYVLLREYARQLGKPLVMSRSPGALTVEMEYRHLTGECLPQSSAQSAIVMWDASERTRKVLLAMLREIDQESGPIEAPIPRPKTMYEITKPPVEIVAKDDASPMLSVTKNPFAVAKQLLGR